MNKSINTQTPSRSIFFALGFALITGLLWSPFVGSASIVQQPAGPRTITIPAGGTATIQARAFCLDFGKDFPTGSVKAKGLADEKIRAALNYAINKGYTEGNPQQVELAIWYLRDNTWHAEEHAIGQEVLDNAVTAPTDSTDGIGLADAVAQGKASVSAKFTPQTDGNFYGDGDVEVKNLTDAELKVSMNIGLFFEAPAANFQNLVAYEIGASTVAVQNTPVITAAVPTITQQPTVQPTLTAMVATETPIAQPTAAMEAPTSVPEMTGTGGGDLPGAGVPDSTPVLLIALSLIGALAFIAVGAAVRRKQI